MATKRGEVRQELRRADNNLDKAGIHLERVSQEFKEFYPEVSMLLVTLQAVIVEMKANIMRLHDTI